MATKKSGKGQSASALKLARREVRARSFELPIWLDDALRAKTQEGFNVSKFLALQAENLVKGDGEIVDSVTLHIAVAVREEVNRQLGGKGTKRAKTRTQKKK